MYENGPFPSNMFRIYRLGGHGGFADFVVKDWKSDMWIFGLFLVEFLGHGKKGGGHKVLRAVLGMSSETYFADWKMFVLLYWVSTQK